MTSLYSSIRLPFALLFLAMVTFSFGCDGQQGSQPASSPAAAPPPAPVSTVKKLTCSASWTTDDGKQRESEWTAVFDTKDFSKEQPQYSYTATKSLVDGETREGAEITLALGRTFLEPYEVTPTSLLFEFCGLHALPGLPGAVTYCTQRDGTNLRSDVTVSRETLTYPLRDGIVGQCVMEDVVQNNLL